jgi:PAS domain S-box-containing protein
MKRSWRVQLFNSDVKSGRVSKLLASLTIVFILFGSYSGWRVWNEIGQMTEARNDVIPWNLSQLEVEYLLFAGSVHHFSEVIRQNDSERIQKSQAETRTRFDVFYSRVATLSESDLYRSVRSAPESADHFLALQAFAIEAASTIDNLENEDAEAVRQLEAKTTDIQNSVRKISLVGVNLHSAQSEKYRQGVFATLIQYLFAMSGLFLALTLIASLLWTTAKALRLQTAASLANAARLKGVFDASPYPILVLGDGERILDVSRAAESAFGYSSKEFADLKAQDLFLTEPSVRTSNFPPSLPEGETSIGTETVQQSLLARRQDGTTFHSISLRSHAIERERSVEIMVVRDISQTLKYEKQLLESRDQARAGEKAKERLLAVISHEMRTPLHAILGAIELLGRTHLTSRQKELSDISEQSAQNLLTQVNNLLRIARDTSNGLIADIRNFHLGLLVNTISESNKILAAQNNNSIEAHIPSEADEFVRGDPEALRQILVNLMSNAIKFTKDGQISLSVQKDGARGAYLFEVRDTGVGIAPELREEIFNDFYTVETNGQLMPAGTGLGLGIVRRLVEAMQGTITFESEPGKGSCFTVSVPLDNVVEVPKNIDEAPVDLQASANRIQDGNIKNILVAEDDAFSRRLLTEGLQSLGFDVESATNGNEAVRLAATRQFDCIILDINMPELDGTMAAAAIRSQAGACLNTPIIALTAHVFPEEMKEISRAGFTKILNKPLSMIELLSELDELASQSKVRSTPDSAKLIDGAKFREIIEIYGEEKTSELLNEYQKDCIEKLGSLTASTVDFEGVGQYLRELHTLRGSSALFGARHCVETILELETLARAGHYSTSLDGLSSLRAIFEETFRAFQTILNHAATADADA